ncbi:hypothetical protein ACFU7Y_03635 [Kitasatospora sp. NPDC057542]|uniref:hypothetical protein n=1 Tax=Kitasatospora sp. NPDC057542 TaxID=3346162 RepID=UPI0036C47F60
MPIVEGNGIGAISVSLPMAQAHRPAGIAAQLRTRTGDDFAAAAFGIRPRRPGRLRAGGGPVSRRERCRRC